MIIKNCRS